jgi:multidrug efflux pump
MQISNFAIHHRTTVFIVILFIAIMGTWAYMTIPRESNPDITFPYVIVVSNYEGTSPSDMESLVTRPLEQKLKTITEIKEMTSTSSEGSSQIFMEFNPDMETDTALQKVRDKVDQAKRDLPNDMDDPSIMEISSSDWPILLVVVSGDVGLVQLKKIAENIKDDIEGVNGVLAAKLVGGLEREIRVEFDQDRLSSYGLTLSNVVQTVQNNNKNMPAGSLDIGEARYMLKAPGEFQSPDEINNLVVAVRNKQPIYINDIAEIRDTFKDRTSYSRLNGVESVSIEVTKRAGEHILRIADDIKAIVADYQATMPEQVTITVTSDASKDIHVLVADLENNMATGMLLVLLVIFFSMGFRNAMLVGIALPLSMLLSFVIIQGLGITMNFIVLFSLILASGMLVDNAIVIIDNIYRHHTVERKPLVKAAMDATAEVAWPVISSTITTVVVFIPLLFWPGIMGEFMGYLPKTVIITLLASLFVSLTINPALAAIFIKASKREDKIVDRENQQQFGYIIQAYRRALRFTLNYRLLFLSLFFILLVAFGYIYVKSGLGTILFPDTEPTYLTVKMTTPEGTNVAQTNNFAMQAEQIVLTYGNLKYATTTVGNGGANQARIEIEMVDRELRKEAGEPGTDDGKIYFRDSNQTMEALRKALTASMVGAEVTVSKQEMGPPTGAPINVEIHGDDFAVMSRISENLQNNIRNIPGIVDLKDDYETGLPEIQVKIDKERAALLGLDVSLVGYVIKAAVQGVRIGSYREGEDEYDITARLPEAQRQNIQNIMRLRIPGYAGEQVPLTSVATVKTTSGLSAIQHIEQKRVMAVSAEVAQGFNAQQVLAEVQKVAAAMQMPDGYSLQYTGENTDTQETQAFLIKAFLVALLFIFLVLVLQFDSILSPFIIMTSVILSLIGVLMSLVVLHSPFVLVMTGIAVICLAGVVVNNAIVLIDYMNVLRKQGKEFTEAILLAGSTRFRPVMLTAVTTVLGLLPMALGVSIDVHTFTIASGSDMSQYWIAMSTAVIFGLSVATLLTLFVVPDLYSLFFYRKPKKVMVEDAVPQQEPIHIENANSVELA